MNELADDLQRLGVPVVAGFSTHPHTDHLLWHARFGAVPRYATAGGAKFAAETREQQLEGPEEDGWSDVPLELIALVTALPADGGPVPGEIIEHQAHVVGHAAIELADRGVLLAGDMLSDVLIPIFDPFQPTNWAPMSRHSTCWTRPSGESMSWSLATALLPIARRRRTASPLIVPTSPH